MNENEREMPDSKTSWTTAKEYYEDCCTMGEKVGLFWLSYEALSKAKKEWWTTMWIKYGKNHEI